MKPDLQFILITQNLGSVTLTHSPDGWDDNFVRWERSTKYWGFFRSFTTQLRFVKEGAEILRYELYTNGLLADVYVQIKRLNRITLQYELTYTAKVDFNTMKDTEFFVDVSLVDAGLSKLIKDNEGTEYSVPINWQEAKRFRYNDRWVEYEDFSQLFMALMDEITDGGISDETYGVQCDVLEPLIRREVLTSSGAAYNSGALYSIKTSFLNLFKALNARLSLGVGVEIIDGKETVILAPISYFFQPNEIARFDYVKDFEMQVANDLLFSTVKIGYPEQSASDTLDTSNEPNTTTTFRSPVTGITNELDLISPFRGDFTGFEEAASSDISDDEVFIIELYADPTNPYWLTPDPGTLRKTGSATSYLIYNSGITPRQMALNHLQYFSSCSFQPGAIVFLTSGNENFRNLIRVGDDYVAEYSNLALTWPVDALFVPLKFKITVPLPVDFSTALQAAIKGKVRFKFNGDYYYGYILDVKAKLAGKSEADLVLLASFDNDLTNLIR